MTIKELLTLQILLAKWRRSQQLTHAQRDWLENMSIAISEKVIYHTTEDRSKIPF